MSPPADGTARLGERLLRLLPSPRQGESSRPSFGRLLSHLLGSEETLARLGLIAILAALCGTGVLLLLNAEAKAVDEHGYSILTALLFIAILILYRASQKHLVCSAAAAIETALDYKRQRLVEDVSQLSLRDLEQLGLQRLNDGLAGHYGSLSQTLVPIISGVEALILLVFMFGYVLYLSMFAGVLTVVVVGLAIIDYLNRSKEMENEMAATAETDARFRALVDAIAHGAKELRLNFSRQTALQNVLSSCSSALAQGRSASAALFGDLIATGTSVSYLIAGAVVFLLPLLAKEDGNEISRVVIAVIFLLGPIGSVIQTVQQLATAQFALAAIEGFEAKVARLQRTSDPDIQPGQPALDFTRIELEAVHYRHHHDQGGGFSINIDHLELKRGEIIFLTGGNGSGKTTLLRVLTGLYPRAAGSLRVDDRSVPQMPSQAYRERFASVFTDFYLFDQPYGLDTQGQALLDHWLRQLQIRDKFGADLHQLQTEALSTGQRKRLALAVALAERRPILVLDEWAADQDPQTRKRFYTEILPEIKANGGTVFAITHDEQYFHCCDRRFHMLEGQLVHEKSVC